MGKCTLDLSVSFDATGDTPRHKAIEIAGLIRTFLAVQLDAANVRVSVNESTLNYVEAYEAEKAEPERDDVAEYRAAQKRGMPYASPLGDPAKDGLN